MNEIVNEIGLYLSVLWGFSNGYWIARSLDKTVVDGTVVFVGVLLLALLLAL